MSIFFGNNQTAQNWQHDLAWLYPQDKSSFNEGAKSSGIDPTLRGNRLIEKRPGEYQVVEKPFGYVIGEQVIAPVIDSVASLGRGFFHSIQTTKNCIGESRPFQFVKSAFVSFDQSLKFPSAYAGWLDGGVKKLGGHISGGGKKLGGHIAKGGKKAGKDISDTGKKAGKDISNAAKVAGEQLEEGLTEVIRLHEEGIIRYGEHFKGAAGNLYKLATGEHKLSPKAFREAADKARKDWNEEMERAPEPIRLVDGTIKAMVEGDPEGTAILLASFVADVYAPGSGQLIRQAYMVHNLAKSGMQPDKIVEQIAKGNADQILTTLVESTYPEYAGAAKTVIEGKKAYDTYKNNEELIQAAMSGDPKARGFLAQNLIAMHPDVAEKFEAHGMSAQDIVGLHQGDPNAARSLVMSGMKMSVETTVKDVESWLEKESESLSDEEIESWVEKEGLPLEGDTESGTLGHEEIESQLGKEGQLLEEDLASGTCFGTLCDLEVTDDRPQIKNPDPTISHRGEPESELGNAGEKVGKKIGEKATEDAVEYLEDENLKKVDTESKEQVRKQQKEAKKSGQAEGKTKKEIKADRSEVRQKIEQQAAHTKKKIKAAVAGAKYGAKAYDLKENTESAVIENSVEFLAKIADKVTKSGGKWASRFAGGPTVLITEMFSSDSIGKESEFEGEELCKNLGFASCKEYDDWLKEKNAP